MQAKRKKEEERENVQIKNGKREKSPNRQKTKYILFIHKIHIFGHLYSAATALRLHPLPHLLGFSEAL